MKHLIIIGVGGFAREVYWHAQDSRGYGTEWELKGFLDGDIRLGEKEYKKLELPVLGDVNSYVIQKDDVFVCVIANPKVREKIVTELEQRGAVFINLIHNTAIVVGNVQMGRGNVLCPEVHLMDNVTIGNFIIFNGRSGMGHDAEMGDFSSLMSAVDITGYTKVGKRTFWGSGSRSVPCSMIEDDAIIGIASVVFKRVKAGQKVFGNPARAI